MANIADVIKCECTNDIVIWKHPSEDFNTMTQLIVHESQEAIFYANGMIQDVFGPGRHTLTTENIPILTKALNRLTNDKNPFHCEVYFVNKIELMNIKWGIPESFVYQAMINGEKIPFNLGARGEMSVKVNNGRMLLEKIVGTESILSKEQLITKLFSIVTSGVKSNLVRIMGERNIEIFEVDSNLDELSNSIKPLIQDSLIDYGIWLELFMILQVKLPENDPNFQTYKKLKFRSLTLGEIDLEQEILLREKHGEMMRVEMEARGMAQKRQIEGYTYQQERGFDIAANAASNESTGQFSNLGIGLGMMAGVGRTIGNQIGEMTENAMYNITNQENDDNRFCTTCNAQLPSGAMFCMSCGTKVEITEDKSICPTCGMKTPKGAFCINCGHKMINTCSKCGAELPDNARFCLNCGESIQ